MSNWTPAGGRSALTGVLVTLRAKEFCVLEYLMARPEQSVSRTDLHCWDAAADPMSNVVDVTITRLRGRLRGVPT